MVGGRYRLAMACDASRPKDAPGHVIARLVVFRASRVVPCTLHPLLPPSTTCTQSPYERCLSLLLTGFSTRLSWIRGCPLSVYHRGDSR